MRILIDIGHPAHVHLFRNLALEMQQQGHAILFTCRRRKHVLELLKHYGFRYKCFGNQYKTPPGKIAGLIEFDIKSLITGIGFKPDIFLSHGSMYAAHAAFLLRKPHISLEDTFNSEQVRLYKPFTKAILTGDYDHPLMHSPKVIKYAGYHELAYLHPNRFTPDKSVLHELGVTADQPYVIMRFVGWQATHDKGHSGISDENKMEAVKAFTKHAKVFITSEAALPDELEPYRILLKPHRLHDAIAFSSLVFGEGFTMLTEAALLGVPSVLISSMNCLYLKDIQQNFGLAYNFSASGHDQIQAIIKGLELLQDKNACSQWLENRQKMLASKIDVTAFLVWFIENWPHSLRTSRQNPDFPNRFK